MQIFTYVLSVTKKYIYIKITFDPLQCYHRKKNIYNAIVACQRLYIMQWQHDKEGR